MVVGDVFYSKLFMIHPELKKMFPTSMDEQYKKLLDMLSLIVARLERLKEVTDDIAALGQRHAGYGVKPEHYEMVGSALLWTLKQGLGSDWTPEVEESWKSCYAFLSNTMINASKDV